MQPYRRLPIDARTVTSCFGNIIKTKIAKSILWESIASMELIVKKYYVFNYDFKKYFIFLRAVLGSQKNWKEDTEFPIYYLPQPMHTLLHYQHHSQNFVTRDAPKLTHHNHPKFMVYLRVHCGFFFICLSKAVCSSSFMFFLAYSFYFIIFYFLITVYF